VYVACIVQSRNVELKENSLQSLLLSLFILIRTLIIAHVLNLKLAAARVWLLV